MFWTHEKVKGELDDCDCDVETIDGFNNDQLYHKLQTLLESDYFRFYKVTWPDLSAWVAHKLTWMWPSLSLLTSTAGQPEQGVSFLEIREPLWYKGLCREALFSCWLIFFTCQQPVLSRKPLIYEYFTMNLQNEVPEGVRATYHSKVSACVESQFQFNTDITALKIKQNNINNNSMGFVVSECELQSPFRIRQKRWSVNEFFLLEHLCQRF